MTNQKKFKKGDIVAKVIQYGTFPGVVAFGFKILKESKGVLRITEYGSDEMSCLEFDSKTGREVNGVNTSYLLTEHEAISRVKSGKMKLDGGESLPKPKSIKGKKSK